MDWHSPGVTGGYHEESVYILGFELITSLTRAKKEGVATDFMMSALVAPVWELRAE
jgi:hypothetical protein